MPGHTCCCCCCGGDGDSLSEFTSSELYEELDRRGSVPFDADERRAEVALKLRHMSWARRVPPSVAVELIALAVELERLAPKQRQWIDRERRAAPAPALSET